MRGFGLAGFGLIVAYLLSGLWLAHVREKPVYERPALLVHPWFRTAYSACRGILFLTGWVLAVQEFPRVSLLVVLVLVGSWAWWRFLHGRPHRRRMVRRAFDREKARDPAAGDVQILRRIVHSMHPRWGNELIEQIAADNPTPERVADMVLRLERGALPSGFNPSRMLRR